MLVLEEDGTEIDENDVLREFASQSKPILLLEKNGKLKNATGESGFHGVCLSMN